MEKKDAKPNENVKQPAANPQESEKKQVDEVYFFHPVQLSDDKEVLDEKEIEKSNTEFEQKLHEFLTSINEDVLQLSEFLMEENKIVNELCNALKQILKKLNVSFNIPPKDLPVKRKISKAILNEEGHLVLLSEKGDVHSAFLGDYPPQIVMNVLWVAMPELAKAITLYRKKISTRVSFFEKLRKELKSIAKAVAKGDIEGLEESEEQTMDVVKNSLTNETRQG